MAPLSCSDNSYSFLDLFRTHLPILSGLMQPLQVTHFVLDGCSFINLFTRSGSDIKGLAIPKYPIPVLFNTCSMCRKSRLPPVRITGIWHLFAIVAASSLKYISSFAGQEIQL